MLMSGSILIQIFLENFGKFLLICLKLQNNLILTLLNSEKKNFTLSFLPSSQIYFFARAGGWGSYNGDMKTTFALPFTLVHFKGINFSLFMPYQLKWPAK